MRVGSCVYANCLQEAQIVLEERAQVVDAVAQHRKAFHAQAEGKAGVALRIDAAVAQHVRMHHAAAEHFQPARAAVFGVPADVDFGRGLGEGEIARAETHLEVALEERADEFGQRALQVGEARCLVDQQAFDLVEHRRMRLVRVAAIDLARRDHADRRLAALHRTDLHRRGMRAQQAAIAEIEGVVHRARRMVRREIQRLEVVPVVLDLRTVGARNPGAEDDRAMRSSARVIGWMPPRSPLRPGRVMSMVSEARR